MHERTRRIFTKDSKSEKRKRGRESKKERKERKRERERVERTANDKRSVGQRAPKNVIGSLLLRQYDGVQTPS